MSTLPRVRSYRDLLVWQKAIDLAVRAYELTRRFPHEELYGSAQQIRKSSASIPANIAEGYGRRSTKEYIQFVSIAVGSLRETETHLELAGRLEHISRNELDEMTGRIEEIGRMLVSLRRSLIRRISK